MIKVVIWNDPHVPYEDPDAKCATIDLLAYFRPDVAVLAGDLLDFYQLSPFDREPARRFDLPQDLGKANAYLDDFDKVLAQRHAADGALRKVFLAGNHSDRFRRYLWRTAPELVGVRGNDIPDLFRLKERSWEYIPYFDAVKAVGAPGLDLYGLLIMHGIAYSQHSAYSAKRHFDRFHCSGVCGHTHRLGEFYFRSYGGSFKWLESGCQCLLEPPHTPSPNWQAGLVAGYIWDKEGDNRPRFDLRTIPYIGGKLAFEGKLFHA